ncbi:MAG TPA: type II secretion system minor pseudopilin GspH [Rhodanobacteraceae bacterium]|nr:type II secretion system minor pseudopilin GspH [Rhodanobacteraceae bacterium]
MRARGFTLIELLVAIAIIAVLALAVGLGLSGLGGTRELERQAERLQAHLAWACETAELDGRSVGLRQTEQGYAFLERRPDGWRTLRKQAALTSYRLPAGVELRLQRDGAWLQPAPASSSGAAPQLACFPSGDMTPFVAILRGDGADRRYRLRGDAAGALTLDTLDVAP